MKHDVWTPGFNCQGCREQFDKTKGAVEPACWFKFCPASRLMNPSFRPWLVVFSWVKDPDLNCMLPKRLADIGWDDVDTLSLLGRMNVRYETEMARKRESERKSSAAAFSGSSGGKRSR